MKGRSGMPPVAWTANEWPPARRACTAQRHALYRVRAANLHQQNRWEACRDATIRVRQRGTLTLPAELREKYGSGVGDTVRILDRDGIIVLAPMVLELAREIERVPAYWQYCFPASKCR